MSILFSAWNIFSHYFMKLLPFYFFHVFFFCCLFITSILGNKQKLWCLLFFHYYKSRAIMYESILKILSVFTFFSDITYERLLRRGFVWNKIKHLIWCWFIFFDWMDKGFCLACEFVFCNNLEWEDRILAPK